MKRADTKKSETGDTKKKDELNGRKVHPYAAMFPPMSAAELEAIALDIAKNGLIDPIVTLDDMILDGVHRLRACVLAEITPRYKEWKSVDGQTPLQYVWAKNLTRRSLSAGQRAVIALETVPQLEKEAAKRKASKSSQHVATLPHAKAKGRARELAGVLAGVSARYIQDAKSLKKSSPELLEQVRLGEISLSAAMLQIKDKETGSNKKDSKVRIVFGNQALTTGMITQKAAQELAGKFVEGDFSTRLMLPKDEETTHMYKGTKTWNPYMGCDFDCKYCRPTFQQQAKRRKNSCGECYDYKPHEHKDRLSKIPAKYDRIFVAGNADISTCSPEYAKKIIAAILKDIEKNPAREYYIQSKRPEALKLFTELPPQNVILVTTLETNRDEGYKAISNAPEPSKRYKQFLALDYSKKHVTVEPVMDFDTNIFADWLTEIKPEQIWLGYNSKESVVFLPEPPHRKMIELATTLVKRKLKVLAKDWRGLDVPPGVERTQ